MIYTLITLLKSKRNLNSKTHLAPRVLDKRLWTFSKQQNYEPGIALNTLYNNAQSTLKSRYTYYPSLT